jgi:hypothetical protein
MSDHVQKKQPQKKQRGGELIIPLLALAFTLYYFYSIKDAPWTAKVSTYFIGSILIALVLLFLVLIARSFMNAEIGLGLARLLQPRALLLRRLLLLVLTIAYIVVLPWGGFTLTTLVFLYLAMLVLGGAPRTALMLALAYAVSGYLLFIAAFQVRFPQGPFEQLLAGLF